MRKMMLVASLVLSCAALPASGQNCAGFTDVLMTDSFCAAVTWMKARGITLGCAGGNYCPSDTVTRAQMALFMYRLGRRADILWVAPTGGDYASIQAAIDAAAASLPPSPTNTILVKIAPGVYNEQVTLKDNIDLEGSGMNATWITGNGSGGTMIAGANSEVRNLSVFNNHSGTFPDAAFAVKQTANTAAGFTLFTHVGLLADGPTDNIAVYVTGGAITIEEGRVAAGPSGGTGAGVPIAADAAGVSAKVRNSILSAGLAATPRYSAFVDNGAAMFIENTQLGGDTSGAPTCFNTYNPGFVAKPCF